MTTRRYRLRRAALFIGGVLLGFVVTAAVAYLYINHTRTRRYEAIASARLGLPADAFRLESIRQDGTLTGTLEDVALLDRSGDTVATVPSVRIRLDARSLNGTGPIVFSSTELRRPFFRLRQSASGDWNVTRIWRVDAKGQRVQTPVAAGQPDRPYLLRNVRIIDGRAIIAMPAGPAPAAAPGTRFASVRAPERVRWGGRAYTLRRVTNLQATMPAIRVGPSGGWRVDLGALRARVTSPDVTVRQLAGWMETRDGENVRFAVRTLRTERSSFEGAGTLRMAANEPFGYDVRLRAQPLDLRDLAGLGFQVPSEGTARFTLQARSLSGGRARIAVRDAEVDVLGSRVAGRLAAVLQPNAPAVFSDTRLTLEPLKLSTLEALGLMAPSQLTGEVRGTVSSVDAVRAGAGTLALDVRATLLPRGGGGEPSVIAALGEVRLGSGSTPLRLEGVRVRAEPLRLATLAALMPAQAALLKGTVTGGAVLSGTLNALTLSGGDLAYQVGSAPATRLDGLSGRIALQPSLSYDLSARAAPLALATLTELFPALPFRSATLSGPITVSGSAARVALRANLNGAAGAINLNTTVALGGRVPRFDLAARIEAFRVGEVLATQSAPQGPLTGTVAARGTTEDFRFDVNLAQGQGTLALGGTVRRPGGSAPQFDVSGQANQFPVGALIGRPDLLAGPVTGPLRVSGGGRQPLRFDVNLRGALGTLAVNGSYSAGAVPSYQVRGNVVGLNLRALPGFTAFPETRITGTVDIDARGLTPESFVGRVAFDAAPGSTVGGVPLDAATVRLRGADGLLRVDTLVLALRGARAEAGGVLGLTRPSTQGIAFTFVAPDLGRIAALLPPTDSGRIVLDGSLSGSGRVSGTLGSPSIVASGSGRGFRYQTYRADAFQLALDARPGPRGWSGTLALDGTGIAAGSLALQQLRLRAGGDAGQARFSVLARRDAQTELTAAGLLELPATGARGALLDSLSLRLGDATWRLAQRARVAYSPDEGIAVENVMLHRSGGAGHAAMISADGVLPPSGAADFRLRAVGVDMADVRRLVPALPDIQGTLGLNAAIRGPVVRPALDVTATVTNLAVGAARADSLSLALASVEGGLRVNAFVRDSGRVLLDAAGQVPITLSLGGTVPGFDIDYEGAVTGRIAADSLPVPLLASAAPGITEAAGVVRIRADVTGTLRRPIVAGGANLYGGGARVAATGVRYDGVTASVRLDRSLITLDLAARTGRSGSARLAGTIRLDDARKPLVYLNGTLSEFQIADLPRVATLQASGALALTGRIPAATLSGSVQLEDGTIQIPASQAGRPLDPADVEVGALGADTVEVAPAGPAALLAQLNARDLRVRIGDNVWIESPDARIQIGGDLDISRSGGATRVTGDLEAKRGTYVLRLGSGLVARDFAIQRGRVQFFGTPDLNPALDVVATNVVRPLDSATPITIFVNVGGTLQNPRIALSSDTRPSLPESELYSLLIFGRRSNDLGTLPGQLAQGILFQEIAGGFISGLEQSLSRAGIFDYVRIRTQSSLNADANDPFSLGRGLIGSPSLELGKQITNRLFFTLEFNNILGSTTAAPAVGAAMDYQISTSTSVRAAYEPVRRDPLLQSLGRINYQFSVDAHRRWEYGRPHVRTEIPKPSPTDTLPDTIVQPPAQSTSPAPQPAPPPPPPAPAGAAVPPPGTESRAP